MHYEGLLRVPVIVKCPGFPVGKKADGPVSILDLGETFFDYGGATPPQTQHGAFLRLWLSGSENRCNLRLLPGYLSLSNLVFAKWGQDLEQRGTFRCKSYERLLSMQSGEEETIAVVQFFCRLRLQHAVIGIDARFSDATQHENLSFGPTHAKI